MFNLAVGFLVLIGYVRNGGHYAIDIIEYCGCRLGCGIHNFLNTEKTLHLLLGGPGNEIIDVTDFIDGFTDDIDAVDCMAGAALYLFYLIRNFFSEDIRLFGQLFDFIGNDFETLSGLTSPGCFNIGIEGQNIGFRRNLPDLCHHLTNLLRRFTKIIDNLFALIGF